MGSRRTMRARPCRVGGEWVASVTCVPISLTLGDGQLRGLCESLRFSHRIRLLTHLLVGRSILLSLLNVLVEPFLAVASR
jgi:hypothetical protein